MHHGPHVVQVVVQAGSQVIHSGAITVPCDKAAVPDLGTVPTGELLAELTRRAHLNDPTPQLGAV